MNKTLKIFAICLLLAMVCGIFIGCEDLRWTYGVIRCRACYVDYDNYDDFAKTNFTAPYYIFKYEKGR